MVKVDIEYLIGTEVIIETDYLPILGMVSGCLTPDLAMLRWIATLCTVGEQNNTQFGDQIYANGAHVQTETHHPVERTITSWMVVDWADDIS